MKFSNQKFLNPSHRSDVHPFHAMDIMDEAIQIEQTGKKVIHMEVGQPSAPAPKPVLELAQKLISDGRFTYTEAKGRLSLRERIAEYYHSMHGVEVSPDRIIVTTGSSARFNLAYHACFDSGDRVAISFPADMWAIQVQFVKSGGS